MKHLVIQLTVMVSLLVFAYQPVSAQKSTLKIADRYYENMDYNRAIDHYKRYLKSKKKHKQGTARLADCYFKTNNYAKAEFWYKKAINLDKRNDELVLNYALTLMSNKKYEDALYYLEDYSRRVPNDERAYRNMDWCYNVESYLQDSSMYDLRRLPINVRESDFGPAFYKNGLVFASARPRKVFDKKYGWTGESFLTMYYTESVNGISWESAVLLEGHKNSNLHEGPATFSKDGRTMYFTKNVKGKKTYDGKVAHLQVFKSEKRQGKWTEPEGVSFNSKEGEESYSVGHPTLSSSGQYLFFTSDMPGGFGGKDIYVVEKKGQGWGKPQNLGAGVNSEGDEMFPFVHEDGTLYFASNGWGGFGGLDVFSSFVKNDEWTAAQNVGYPINDSKDDFGLILTSDKQTGYFATNRGLSDDVYQIFIKEEKAEKMLQKEPLPEPNVVVESVEEKKNEVVTQEIIEPIYSHPVIVETTDAKMHNLYYLTGIVLDSETLLPLKNAQVNVTDENYNRKTFITNEDGNFVFYLDPNKEYIVAKMNGNDIETQELVSTKTPKNSDVIHLTLKGTNTPVVNTTLVSTTTSQTYSGITPAYSGTSYNKTETVVYDDVQYSQQITGYTPSYNRSSVETVYTNDYSDLRFKIQVGAFRKYLDKNASYLQRVTHEVQIEQDEGLNKYVCGDFWDYQMAKEYRDNLRNMGYSNAFVVAYSNGIRVEMPDDLAVR